MRTPKLITAAALAVLALGLTGCADSDEEIRVAEAEQVDCDIRDQRERDEDCGYWQGNDFYAWHWVNWGHVSHSPYGWTPSYPAGTTRKPPKGANLTKKPTRQAAPPVSKAASGGSARSVERRSETRRSTSSSTGGSSSTGRSSGRR